MMGEDGYSKTWLSDAQKLENKAFVDNVRTDINTINQAVIQSAAQRALTSVESTQPIPATAITLPSTCCSVSKQVVQGPNMKTANYNIKGGGSSMSSIQHVKINCTKSEFVNCLDGYVDDDTYLLEEKPTQQGKTMLVFTEKDLSGTEICTLIMNYEPKGEKVEIVPFKLNTRDFITNLSHGLHSALVVLAENNDGDYVGYHNHDKAMVIGGASRQAELRVIEKGTKIDFDVPTVQLGASIKKTIKEYLSEDKDLADLVKDLPYPKNINFIGKYLMQKKIDGGLSSDDFISLFRQVGLLGADDPTILKFYTLFK